MQTNRWIALLFIATCVGCGGSDGEPVPKANIDSPPLGVAGQAAAAERQRDVEPVTLTADDASTQSPASAQAELYPEVVIHTSLGPIRVRLNALKAPRTVHNFLDNYVDRDFYSGSCFHYVEQGVMVVGGGYDADLTPRESRAAILNEADNMLKNVRGTIAMARLPDYPHSATSQFFFNVGDNPTLDYQPATPASTRPLGEGEPVPLPEINGYCVFGEVVEGMDVVDQIAQVPVEERNIFKNTPRDPVVIDRIERIK